MKVFAISDLHLSTINPKPMDIFGDNWNNHFELVKEDWQEKVSDDDLVLLCGDLSWALRLDDAMVDINLVACLKGKKIIIRGNHDYWWNTIGQLRSALPESVYALQNDCLRIGNYLICGTRGWTCPDGKLSDDDDKIYKREVLRMELSLKDMERQRQDGDRVILMMHYPPFNAIRDESEFTKLLVKYSIETVVYGHLHGKDCRSDLIVKRYGATMYLASTDLVNHKLVEII